MASFAYTAKDGSGKTINGVIDSASSQEAAAVLHKKEYIVISLKPVKTEKKTSEKVKPDELVIFSRQLATMIDSGISLVQAFGILAEQIENKALKSVTRSLKQDIEEGASFNESLAKHPKVFPEFFISMVKAGEVSGTLDEILERLANYMEKDAALRRKVGSSLVYPVVIVVMAFSITAVLLLKVVPTFKGIFDMLGGELPAPTQVLIFASELLQKYFFGLAVVIAAFVVLVKKYAQTEKGRYNIDKLQLSLPVFGPLLTKVAVVKFSRTLATLVKSGVPILNSLEIVGSTSGNKVLEKAVLSCRNSIKEGEPISEPLAKSGIFPPMVVRMIGVGEQTGELEKMLNKIADFYDDQVNAAVDGMTSLIEPVVIAFLGVIIGGIVIALFLPIFKITQVMGH